jgi:hypothetical protein
MRGQEVVRPFVNAAPATSAAFELRGGTYQVSFTGTGAGTVDLKELGPDGVTFIACGLTQIVATSGFQNLDLPPGQYEVIVAGFTANYVTVCRIPKE